MFYNKLTFVFHRAHLFNFFKFCFIYPTFFLFWICNLINLLSKNGGNYISFNIIKLYYILLVIYLSKFL